MEKNKHRASSNILATHLGELELQAMEVLWGFPHLDARQIRERLQRTRQPSLSTVQSALERLYRKSYVDRIKQGHAYSYFVTVSRGALLARMLGEAIHLLHDGRMETILSSFVHVAADMDESSLDSLEEMIRDYRRKSGGSDGTPQEGKL